MSRYHNNHVLIFAPIYSDLRYMFGEYIFQEFWDLFSIKGNGKCFEITVTQLGSVPYISDYLPDKYPDFLFLETRSGETGYKENLLTKGSFRKKLDVHFESIPQNNYSQLNDYINSIRNEENKMENNKWQF